MASATAPATGLPGPKDAAAGPINNIMPAPMGDDGADDDTEAVSSSADFSTESWGRTRSGVRSVVVMLRLITTLEV